MQSLQVEFHGTTGQATLGAASDVVGDYILPPKFNKNIGFGEKPNVFLNNAVIGTVLSYKIKSGQIVFSIKLNDYELNDTYRCTFKLNALFSTRVANKILLDQIILDSIHIHEQIIVEN
jgi:hypothetical protein